MSVSRSSVPCLDSTFESSDMQYHSQQQPQRPVTRLQLSLHASKLPSGGTALLGRVHPDTCARVAIVPPDAAALGSRYDVNDKTGHVEPISLGPTEVIRRSSNPRWTKFFLIEYEYGTELNVYVDIVSCNSKEDEKKSLGGSLFEIGDLLGSRNKTKCRRLRKGGCLYAHIEQSNYDSSSSNGYVQFQLRALNLHYNPSGVSRALGTPPDTFFEISRQSQCPSGMSWIVVYRSKPVLGSFTPVWDHAEVDLEKFCNGDMNRNILVSVFIFRRNGSHRLFGSFETTVQTLINSSQSSARLNYSQNDDDQSTGSSFILHRADGQKSREVGRIIVQEGRIVGNVATTIHQRASEASSDDNNSAASADSEEDAHVTVNLEAIPQDRSPIATVLQAAARTRPSFADYVDAGCDIDFCVAVDFTSSNGDPRVPGTLHFNRDGSMNDYEETILSIGNAIARYSRMQEFPVWGFGAKYGGQVRHIFQCGPTSTASGIDGVLDAYRSVFQTDLTMSGPTVLLQVIQAAAARAKRFHNNVQYRMCYSVLLILTDGIVTDIPATRSLLQAVGALPLSVIIVGIGRADFSAMHQLSDSACVTFVEFRPHQHDPQSLSRAGLRQIPDQIVDYFMKNGVYPHQERRVSRHRKRISSITIDSAISELTVDY